MESGDDQLKTRHWKRGVLAIPFVFTLLFGAYPLVSICYRLINTSDAMPMLVTPADVLQLVARAGWQSGLSTAVALLVGLPLAFALSLFEFRGRRFVWALVFVPFVLPTIVTGFAVRGVVGSALQPGLLLVVLGHAFVNVAVVVRFVGSALEALDLRFITQAQSLGAGRLDAWVTVGWRLVAPAIIRASSIVFVFCFSSLGLVLILGDRSVRTLESEVLRQVSLLLDFRGAALNTTLQFVLVGLVLWLGARPRGIATAARSTAQIRRPLPASWRPFVAATVVLYVLPFGWLVMQGIVVGGNLTSAYVFSVWGSAEFWSAFLRSLCLAVAVAGIASCVAGCAAIAATDPKLRVWSRIALLPMMLTSATIGLGMLLTFGRAPFNWDRAGAPLAIAQSLLVLPIAFVTVSQRLDDVDDSMVTMAQSLGASRLRAFFSAYGTALMSGALSAAGLGAAIACGEFGAASFLSNYQAPTLSVYLMRQLSHPGEASIAIASVVAVSLAILAVVMLGFFERLSLTSRKVRR